MRKIAFPVLLLCLAILLSCVCAQAADFTQETYDLCSDIVYSYKVDGISAYEHIRQQLAVLKQKDAALGTAWADLMDYWIYTNSDLVVHPDVLPDGLPEDDSLCIVVLGFQLLPDGEMTDELIGRCQTALNCAQKYPNAYIAVTGGGTASKNRSVTEADSMASWLIDHGIAEERIIIENQSLTTVENARFTCAILDELYPNVRELAIVSSDYHVPLGCLLFRAQELLGAYHNGSSARSVIANAGYPTGASQLSESLPMQGADVWAIAGILE